MAVPREVLDETAAIDRALGDLPSSCTIPLFVDHREHTWPHATAILLAIGQARFVATAAHVVRDARAIGSPLLLGGLHDAQVIVLDHDIIFTGRDSEADIAAWRLRADQVRLFEGKRFLGLGDLWHYDVDPGAGPFMLYGYLADPRGAAGSDLPRGYVNPVKIIMNRSRGPHPEEIYDPDFHLLFGGRVAHGFRAGGEPFHLPSSGYRGISGAGVFAVSLQGRPHALVAIQTCVHPGDIVQGTRIGLLIDLIGAKHHDIRSDVTDFLQTLQMSS